MTWSPKKIFQLGWPYRPSQTVSGSAEQHSLEGRLWNWKQNSRWHWIPNEKQWRQCWFQLYLLTKSHTANWVIWLSSTALFVFEKWCCISCSDQFKLSVNGKITEGFHLPTLQHFPLCPTQVSITSGLLVKTMQSCALQLFKSILFVCVLFPFWTI